MGSNFCRTEKNASRQQSDLTRQILQKKGPDMRVNIKMRALDSHAVCTDCISDYL